MSQLAALERCTAYVAIREIAELIAPAARGWPALLADLPELRAEDASARSQLVAVQRLRLGDLAGACRDADAAVHLGHQQVHPGQRHGRRHAGGGRGGAREGPPHDAGLRSSTRSCTRCTLRVTRLSISTVETS